MTRDLLDRYPIISDQMNKDELRVIVRELQSVLHLPGAVVELGCYVGTTSLFLQRVAEPAGKSLHIYDSFAGLPPKIEADQSPAGAQYQPGTLAATKAQVVANFKRANLPLPQIHKAWFADLAPHHLPQAICFAYLDSDFYQSIIDSLRVVWPKLTPGAAVVVDDYHHEALPGVKKAVDNWLRTHPASLRVQASLAIMRVI